MQNIDQENHKIQKEAEYNQNLLEAHVIEQPQYNIQNGVPYSQTTYVEAVPVQDEMSRNPVIVEQTKVVYVERDGININMYPKFPVQMKCPHCQQHITTRVSHRPGCGTYLASGAICLVCWPLFFLPCVFKETQDAIHYCPKCGHQVGVKTFC